jgi:hypothetical protein
MDFGVSACIGIAYFMSSNIEYEALQHKTASIGWTLYGIAVMRSVWFFIAYGMYSLDLRLFTSLTWFYFAFTSTSATSKVVRQVRGDRQIVGYPWRCSRIASGRSSPRRRYVLMKSATEARRTEDIADIHRLCGAFCSVRTRFS